MFPLKFCLCFRKRFSAEVKVSLMLKRANCRGGGVSDHRATVLCNNNRKFIEEMSSWTALTMRLGMKTVF